MKTKTINIRNMNKASAMASIVMAMAFLFFWQQPLKSQVHTDRNIIFISGQVTNTTNGGPVSNHKIFVEIDSTTNNGLHYYSTIYTDVYGIFYDTIITSHTDGSVELSLTDFNNTAHSSTKHFRFTWSDHYQMVTNFQFYDPNATNELQANFKAKQDTTTSDPLQIIFKNVSAGYVVKSFIWDFGDGQYSEIEDPVHVYDEPGIYLVTFTISSTPLQNDVNNKTTSTITKQVLVGLPEYYNIGGHVFSGYFPIDYGLAYLYEIDSVDQPVPIDTAKIDEFGYYYFYQIREADYIIKSRLAANSVEYGNFIPTYYGDDHIWNNAGVLHVNGENWTYHINLITSDGLNNGTGNIQGQILYDTNTITTDYTPANDIEIILLNGSNTCLTCKLSDLDGQFDFNNIAFGTYQIYPDVTGIKSDPMYIPLLSDPV